MIRTRAVQVVCINICPTGFGYPPHIHTYLTAASDIIPNPQHHRRHQQHQAAPRSGAAAASTAEMPSSSLRLAVMLLLSLSGYRASSAFLLSTSSSTAAAASSAVARLSSRGVQAGSASSGRRGLCMGASSITPGSTSLFPELVAAVKASRRAALAAKGLQKSLLERAKDAGAIAKTDSSPVTVADFSVQALVVGELRAAFPTDQVVAEETSTVLKQDPEALQAVTEVVRREGLGTASYSAEDVCQVLDHGRTPGGARTWILDPIDGTKGFIRGEHFCVALGLALQGDPSLGVLACPNLPYQGHRDNGAKIGDGCLFFAVRGAGAFVMPLAAKAGASVEEEIQKATPIRVSGVASGAEARFFESVEAAHSSHSAAGQVTQALGVVAPPVRLDSQCKYGMLGRGEGEIMLRLPRPGYIENIWDHAPAFVVVTEAGGRVSDTNGKPLDFAVGCRTGDGKLPKEVTGIVTTNGQLHEQVLAALAKAWP